MFNIKENKKVLVQRIDFSGNEHIPDRRIRRFMQTKEAGFLPWLTNAGTFRRDALETDAQIVSQVFLEEGYVDVQVDPPKVYLSPDKRYIFISYHIEEGLQYNYGNIDVQGDFEEDLARVRSLFEELRERRAVLPEDPHLLYATEVESTERPVARSFDVAVASLSDFTGELEFRVAVIDPLGNEEERVFAARVVDHNPELVVEAASGAGGRPSRRPR